MNDKVRALLMFGIFVMGGIVLAANWYSTRGTRILDTQCLWDAQQGAYTASFSVRNEQNVWKLVDYQVSIHLKPPAGRQWSHPRVKQAYETVSNRTIFLIGPGGETTQAVSFPIPDAANFECTVKVHPGWQERFAEEPSDSTIDAIMSRESPSAPAPRGLGRRGF